MMGASSDRGMMNDAAKSSDEEDGGVNPRARGFGASVETSRYRGLSQHHDPNAEESALHPPDRIAQLKVRVQRDQVLHAAKQLFIAHTATRKGAIRAEFHGEEAVGVGPTLEFLALVSQQLCQKSLHVWSKAPFIPAKPSSAAAAIAPASSSTPAPLDTTSMPVPLDELSGSAPASAPPLLLLLLLSLR